MENSFRRLQAIFVAIAIIFSLLIAPSFAKDTAKDYLPQVKSHKLKNGLKLLVVERHDAPVLACYRYHKVGSINERPGITGAAHLLEHMMFKGTEKIGTWNYEAEKPIMAEIEKIMDQIEKEMRKGLTDYQKPDKAKIAKLWDKVKQLQNNQRKYIRKNELDFIYDSSGGNDSNASTWFDRTDYMVNLPANKLEVWAYVESDRMKSPVFREFYSERDVVNEERRMREINPDSALYPALYENMFITMPYGHDVVGWPSDIMTVRKDEVYSLLKKYYAPNNTTIVLVGDITDKKALEIIDKYFARIPSQPDPRPVFTTEPPQKGEKKIDVEFDSSPQILIGFHGPKPGSRDQYALDALSYILSNGRTSRFYRNIVKKDIAFDADTSQWNLAYTNMFIIEGKPKKPYTTVQLENAIYDEIEKLKTTPVTDKELEMVRNKVDMDYINLMESRMDLAETLAEAEAFKGGWRNFDIRDKIHSITAKDITEAANKYLKKSNRTVITLVPTKNSDEAAEE